jgi:Lon-like protease BrxL-like, ATPase domain
MSDYFTEAMRQTRKGSSVRAIDEELAFGSHLSARDERAVRKTVCGLLKILHPHGEWSGGELAEYLELAFGGRRLAIRFARHAGHWGQLKAPLASNRGSRLRAMTLGAGSLLSGSRVVTSSSTSRSSALLSASPMRRVPER